MPRLSYNDLYRLADSTGLRVEQDGVRLTVFARDNTLLYSATQGQKLSGAFAAINQYLQGNLIDAPGRTTPVTYRQTQVNPEGASLIERFYDRELPNEIPIRAPEQGRMLQEMFCDGGVLENAIGKIIDSMFASSDGDDRGWVIADTVGEQPVNPIVYQILFDLWSREIGGLKLSNAAWELLQYGDCFGSKVISSDTPLPRIEALEFLPTYEMFLVDRTLRTQTGLQRERYYEQRRYAADEEYIKIPYMFITHWKLRSRGNKKYGRALFAGKACYRAWQSLVDAQIDLRKASRNVGVTPLKHILPENYSATRIQQYRDSVEEKRRRDGTITDFYMGNGGDISGVFGLGNSLQGLIDTVNYWTKELAIHSNVPLFLFGIDVGGARDIAQQPALAYSRFINSIRGDLTVGIRNLCDTELLLHGLDPSLPENQYEIIWPKIVTNVFDAPVSENADESQQIPDTEETRTVNEGTAQETLVRRKGSVYERAWDAMQRWKHFGGRTEIYNQHVEDTLQRWKT